MASTDRTIEEATQAFCIRPEGWTAAEDLTPHLVSAGELIVTDRDPERRPLLLLARLKLEGLPLMLDPVLAQTSAVDLSLHHILTAWNTLREHGPSDLLEAADLQTDSWRVALLDLQEEEEIGLLFTCANFSIPATLLSSIRGLTLGAMAAHCPRFRALLDSRLTQDLLASCVSTYNGESKVPVKDVASRSSHLFRWSRSSVALDLPSFNDGRFNGIRGYSASLVQVSHPPGHHQEGNHLVRRPQGAAGRQQRLSSKACYHTLYFGSVDMLAGSIISQGRQSWLPARAFGATRQLFQHLYDLCPRLKLPVSEVEASISPSRHITGWVTSIVAPFPLLELADGTLLSSDHRRVEPTHFPYLQAALKRLTHHHLPVPQRPETTEPNHRTRLPDHITCLREAFGFSGLPAGLRRAYIVLFQKYLSLTSHPMRYDAVLDLQDVMRTLWDIFTMHLPHAMWPELRERRRGGQDDQETDLLALPRRLGEKNIQFLAELATAIEDSLDLRLRRTFPDDPVQDWNLDFRGSMNQVVIAGEAVLRAALGLVRRNALERPETPESDRCAILGVANRMTITANILTHFSDLGVEDHARVAYVATDVSHLTNLVQLADYFHEAFHVIHSEMCAPLLPAEKKKSVGPPSGWIKGVLGSLPDSPGTEDEDNASRWVEETGEIFVAMMMLILVADGDLDLLWSHQVNSFATSPRSGLPPQHTVSEANRADLMGTLHEHFGRVFLPLGILTCWLDAKGLLPTATKIPASFLSAALSTLETQANPLSPIEATDVYTSYCRRFRCLLPDAYPVRVPGDDPQMEVNRFWREHVTKRFEMSWGFLVNGSVLEIMWNAALRVAGSVIREAHLGLASKVPPPEPTPLEGHKGMDLKDPKTRVGLAAAWEEMRKQADEMLNPWEQADNSDSSPVSLTTMFAAFQADGHWKDRHSLPTLFLIRALRQAWRLYLPDPARLETLEWRLPRQLRQFRESESSEERGWALPLVALGMDRHIEAGIEWKKKEQQPDIKEYAEYLIDPYRPESFTTTPAAAEKRLVHQAVFIKTLWGISSIIRRRRLENLINTHSQHAFKDNQQVVPTSEDDRPRAEERQDL
ncbi:MAG: hypothetical protein ACO1TE_30150 [Prosthecobacter sp.]